MNLYGVLTLWAQSRFSQSRSIVGAAGAEAARTALAAGDFGTVYQRVAVFDLLGMVAATERARGHLSGGELHVPDGMRQSDHSVGLWVKRPAPKESKGGPINYSDAD